MNVGTNMFVYKVLETPGDKAPWALNFMKNTYIVYLSIACAKFVVFFSIFYGFELNCLKVRTP